MVTRVFSVLLIASVVLMPLPVAAAGSLVPSPQQEELPESGEEPFPTNPADTQAAGLQPPQLDQTSPSAAPGSQSAPAPMIETVLITEVVPVEQLVLVTETVTLTEVVPVEVIVPVTETVLITEVVPVEQVVLVTETATLTATVPADVIVPEAAPALATEGAYATETADAIAGPAGPAPELPPQP